MWTGRQSMNLTFRTLASASLALAMAGCAGTTGTTTASSTPDDPGFGHVHGLGLNPADGLVYAATHFGVFRLDPSGAERVADRYQDTMGFTVAGPDRFLGSGHPDLREGKPPHLGLVESTDRAETWTSVSLEGEVDFHALAAVGPNVYGWDATTGVLMHSSDAGATWSTGPVLAVSDLDVDPTDPERLVVASENGLLESDDAGATLSPMPGQPPRRLAYIRFSPASTSDQQLVGVDEEGTVWTDAEGRWTQVGSLPGPPEAFAVAADGRLLAATSAGVFISTDSAASWELLAETAGHG